MRKSADAEAFGFYTEVRSLDPSFGRPPAYSGGNAREELDDVESGSEVALKSVDLSIHLKTDDRESTSRTFTVSYRVDYDDRAVVAKTVTEKHGSKHKSDATIAALPLAAAVARADRAAAEFLDREGLGFELRSFAGLIDGARDEAHDVLVSDVETIVDADRRADQQRQSAGAD